MTLRILAVGDIHLGRRPGSVPDDVAASAGGRDALGPRAAWQATVDRAIQERVQAVVLLGDVVDDEERYLEGWSALETGLRRLITAGIEVFAVAGNHDVRVLPRLASTLSGLHLVGAGGQWESVEIANGAGRFVGWSYPTAHARTDPTHDPELARLLATRGAGPTIGLLHGDLDAAQSDYARFSGARLAALGADTWLLGHVHGPTFARAAAGRISMGFLGSLTALDPTETGVHGPWLLTYAGRELVEAQHLALATLRWECVAVAVDAWTSVEDLEPGVTGALRDFDAREAANIGAARVVGLRIELTGRCKFHRDLQRAIERFAHDQLRPTLDGRAFFVDAIVDRVRAELDLQALARDTDPPGLLAQRLLALDALPSDVTNTGERARILRLARDARESLTRRSEFVAIPRAELRDEVLIEEVREAGLTALEELLASRANAEAGA